MFTAGYLKTLIARDNLGWNVNPALHEHTLIHEHALGGTDVPPVLASEAPAIKWSSVLEIPSNAFVMQRRIDLSLVPAHELVSLPLSLASMETKLAPIVGRLTADAEDATGADPSGGGAHAARVDWRNRWGMNWITGIRDQSNCGSCWAFATTALVEAMVHVEHCVWTVLSEGDINVGGGASPCGDNNLNFAKDYVVNHGLCDPGCFPYSYPPHAYTPTPDRSGRSVRAGTFTWVGSVDDQKTWIDTIGPLATWFDVWHDFDGWHAGPPYVKSSDPSNYRRGGHFMLVVGYDDALGAWIVKNSWGTGYGDHGYYLIGYGQAGIDSGAKLGFQNCNPDPWTKRRLHNGNLLESGNGAMHRNLEVLSAGTSGQVTHHWREGGPPWTWGTAARFGGDAQVCPTLVSTTFNRNFETVYATNRGQLHHWWLDQTNPGAGWHDGGTFGSGGAFGAVGFIQGNYGAPGNFEVVVARNGQLTHYWRDGGGWHEGVQFGANIRQCGCSLVQSQYGRQGNFELVAQLNNGTMQHFWRDNDNGMVWRSGPVFGAGIDTAPVMIEGQFAAGNEFAVGNFELCVAAGGQVQHWWRNNGGDGVWRMSTRFGHNVRAVAGLCESSWGFNLEVIVLRDDGQLQHYWRGGSTWNEGPVIGPA